MPRRGEIWWADLDPVVGRELGRKIRPVLVVSTDEMNTSDLEKVIVVPSTTQPHALESRVPWRVRTPTGTVRSFFCCDDVRSISTERLRGRVGERPVPAAVVTQVEETLRLLMAL